MPVARAIEKWGGLGTNSFLTCFTPADYYDSDEYEKEEEDVKSLDKIKYTYQLQQVRNNCGKPRVFTHFFHYFKQPFSSDSFLLNICRSNHKQFSLLSAI